MRKLRGIFARFLVKMYYSEPERQVFTFSRSLFMSKRSFCLFLAALSLLGACNTADQQQNASGDKNLSLDGQALFRKNCITCHGADGTLGLNGAKDLSKSVLPLEERIPIVTNGKNMMTPFGNILSPEQIRAVAEYTLSLKKN